MLEMSIVGKIGEIFNERYIVCLKNRFKLVACGMTNFRHASRKNSGPWTSQAYAAYVRDTEYLMTI